MNRSTILAFAAFTLVSAASATTIAIPTPDPVTMTFDGAKLSATQGLLCTHGDVNCFSYSFQTKQPELATGVHTLSFDFVSPTGFGTYFGAWYTAAVKTPPSDVQLRFSNASVQTTIKILDRESGYVYGTSSGNWLANVHPAPATTHLGIDITFNFIGGNFLTASNDPTCASLSCMTPGSDKLNLSMIGVSAVPEPSQAAMLIGGLALAGYVVRRRKRA